MGSVSHSTSLLLLLLMMMMMHNGEDSHRGNFKSKRAIIALNVGRSQGRKEPEEISQL
jgi:hypothetical protein